MFQPPPLASLVLDELKVLRKTPGGVTVESLALANTICHLLGSGDPYLAYTRLQHAMLDVTVDRSVRAAAASLGFASAGDSHLDRLVEGGDELGLEQRQVRRLSDQGLLVIAKLIATNWTVQAVPELTAFMTSTPDQFELVVATTRPLVIEMSEPEIELLTGELRDVPALSWSRSDENGIERSRLNGQVTIEQSVAETSVVVVWRGELWPKFTVRWQGSATWSMTETLGNKLMIRLPTSIEPS